MQNAASKSLSIPPSATPLVNLFAYIRDLFTNTRPSLRFDSDPHSPFWPLAQLAALADQPPLSASLTCQWKDTAQPILKIQRVENQTFEQNSERIRIFDELFLQVNDKPLEEVQHLSFPPELDAWVSVSLHEGRVQLEKRTTANDFSSALNLTYDALHDLFYTLQSQPDRQICLSFGLISGKIGGEVYQNFLFHIPLKITLKRQMISLEADTLAHVISCEESFSDLLDLHFSRETEEKVQERKLRILREVDNFNSQSREFSFEPDYLRGSFYESAVKIAEVFSRVNDRFFTEGKLNFDLPENTGDEEITLSFSPVIHVRNLATGVVIARDADKIIARINELGTRGENESIPDFFKKLFSLRKPGNPLRIAYRTEDKSAGFSPQISETLPERFLFPLPYNDEQLSIAQQLLRQDAVTVQGPPGTGKSHTIANLASHFVAEGKSILIVSKNAKALEVIKGKLPPAIRPLAVALLDGNQNHEELKHAIDAVKNHLNQIYDPAETAKMEAELSNLEKNYKQLRQTFADQIRQNQRQGSLYDPRSRQLATNTATRWAEIWDKLDRENVPIRDVVLYDQDTQTLAEEIFRLAQRLPQADLTLAAVKLPEETLFPDLAHAEKIHTEWQKIKAKVDMTAYTEVETHLLENEFLLLLLEMYEGWREIAPWQEILRKSGRDIEELTYVFARYRDLREEAENAHSSLLAWKVSGLPEADPDQMLESLQKLLEKWGDSDKLSLLQKKFLPENQRVFLAATVNGREVRGKEDLQVIENLLRQQSRLKKLTIVLNNAIAFSGKKIAENEALNTFDEWETFLFHLQKLTAFNQKLQNRQLPTLDLRSEKVAEQWAFLRGLQDFFQHEQLQAEWKNLIQPLLPFISQHAAIQKLTEHWAAGNFTGVEKVMEEITQLREKIHQTNQLLEEREKLEKVLPRTIAELTDKRGSAWTLDEWEYGIFIKKLESFLSETLEMLGNPNDIFVQLQENQKQQETLICDLVAVKTWQHKQASVTDPQKAALSAWRNDLINIGKGHGKNTERNRTSAIANMQLAREVVPIWIMQQETAISFFPDPQPGQFDLLIVDEASQCDISMLNLIFRCKKCIIVGDENQTSVATQARLFPIERTNQLLDRYLIHHPFKQQFNINNRSTSIYSLSGVIYPNIISLREHFRCRPELIGFSNQYVYDSHIIPLRTVSNSVYGSATEVHYVEDDPQDERKPALVKAAVQLIASLVEDVQAGHLPKIPTVGILCLDSSNESHRELLIRELGRHPLIKTVADELELLIGTSREFQGDERDIMLLTTTASHKFAAGGDIRAPRAVMGEEMLRIYNVAASRARDKAILLHSIHPEAVAKMNPECFRKRLIDYFEQNSRSSGEKTLSPKKHPAKGTCTEELYEWAVDAGWADYLFPQYKIGPYSIDLAILREGLKIALFIDGATENDSDIEKAQQLVLERAGWLCLRVQTLQWFCSRGEIKNRLSEMMG
ncbi:MAG: AAA domain-containing protein [Bacteroidia bacterium]|nr:AAA domain-containing protein [Bacteroidia bacterium]